MNARFPANPVYSGIDTGMVNIDTVKITTQLLALLSDLDEFKGAWRTLGTIASISGCSCDNVAVDRLGTGCPDQLV